jgi:hypothetical protein
MKKFLGIALVFLLTVTLVTGVTASPASAAAAQSGYLVGEYWFTIIDSAGQPSGYLDAVYQNSAQYTIYNSPSPAAYILTAHPNYEPVSDDQAIAQTTTLVTAIQRYNQNEVKENCVVGGTYQIPANYLRITAGGVPYLKFAVTFTTYDNHTGAVIGGDTADPVYFNLNKITPAP